jgi:hypothetical protein
VLKLIGLGSYFWYEPWNVFAVLNVVLYFADIALYIVEKKPVRILQTISQIIRIIHALKVSHIFKAFGCLRNLQTIISIVQICFAPILSLFILTAIIFYIYAIIGCYLFHDVPHGKEINDIYNFENFGKAIVLVIKLATGEDVHLIMFECAQVADDCVAGIGCGKWYAYVYFLSFRVFLNLLFLHLFLLIVLHFFDKYFIPESNNINAFKSDFDVFKEKWAISKPKYWGNFIHVNKLLSFFHNLPSTFEFDTENPNILSKQVTSLKIMQ